MAIPFTQYLMPDGRKQAVDIERPEEIEKMAQDIINKGHRFECEMLGDYQTCSFTISAIDPNEPDVAITLARNGPNVPIKIDEMITKFHKQMMENSDV